MCAYVRTWGAPRPQVSAVRGDLLWHSRPVRWRSYRQAPVALNSSGQQLTHRLSASGNDEVGHVSVCKPLSRRPARPHHYLRINVPVSDHVQSCISTITHRDIKNQKVYFSLPCRTHFHSFVMLLKFGRCFTEIKRVQLLKLIFCSLFLFPSTEIVVKSNKSRANGPPISVFGELTADIYQLLSIGLYLKQVVQIGLLATASRTEGSDLLILTCVKDGGQWHFLRLKSTDFAWNPVAISILYLLRASRAFLRKD